jgi:hypothetical protein
MINNHKGRDAVSATNPKEDIITQEVKINSKEKS